MAKKRPGAKTSDPHAQREAQRYENPIASREMILELLKDAPKPLPNAEIAESLGLSEDQDLEALRRRLRAMQRDGQIHADRRGAYAPVEALNLLRCRVQGHRDGYGFAVVPDGDDVFLSARQMRELFDGDTVLVGVTGMDPRGRPEGRVVEVLERGVTQVVGRYEEESGIGFVRPDNRRLSQDILIPPKERGDAAHGQIVTAEITHYPQGRIGAKGRITEVLGDHLDPGLEIDVAIRSHGIPWEWPDEVLNEAGGFRDEPTADDKRHRIDLRELPFVTIDGEDARDFDDAVCCRKRRGGGWLLWVAIADVSHYVAVGSALDVEAARRGNSVYFPERVVPMLPEVLSNGLCSLNPRVDRLAMAVEMRISAAGELEDFSFCEALIRSQARLTYTQVGALLESGDHEDIPKPLHGGLRELHALYGALRGARDKRGAIDFETVETRIVFNEQRKIEAIVPVRRNDAHKVIEECMLCANVAAARFFDRHALPVLYRVHEGPSAEKLENLRSFLGELGLGLRGGATPTPEDYQLLLEQVADRPDAHIIQTMLLRSLSQAVYRPENGGHFGLNYPEYVHFTSPIRRYPDLLVHRAIRSVIRSKVRSRLVRRADGAGPIPTQQIYPYDPAAMAAVGEQCSVTERRADDATREVEAWLKCEYLREHVGQEFDGVVASVTNFGLFVELKDLYIEGLVHISNLPGDYYHFDIPKQRLVGERSGRSFQLGAPIRVLVAAVKLDERKIDLEPVSLPTTDKQRRSGRDAEEGTGEKSGGRKRGKRSGAGTDRGGKQTAKAAKTDNPGKDGKDGKDAKPDAKRGKSRRGKRGKR